MSVPETIGLERPLELVDFGLLDGEGSRFSWAVYSDWAGNQAMLVGGLPESITSGEAALIATMYFDQAVESRGGRKVRISIKGGGHKVYSEPNQRPQWRIFTLSQVHIFDSDRVPDFFNFYLTGFHWLNNGDIDFLVGDCRAVISPLAAAEISNDHAHVFLRNMLTCVLRVHSSDKEKACKVRDSLVLGLQVVCGTQVATSAIAGVHEDAGRNVQVSFLRPMRRPFLPLSPVDVDSMAACLQNASNKILSLGEAELRAAKRTISLCIDAVNQSTFVEVRALIACMAVEEIVEKLIGVKAQRTSKANSTHKKQLKTCAESIGQCLGMDKQRIKDACEGFWRVANSRFDEHLVESARFVGADVSEQEAALFVGFRNALVHERDPTKNKKWRKAGEALTIMEGYARVLWTMDKLVIGFFCGAAPNCDRGRLIQQAHS